MASYYHYYYYYHYNNYLLHVSMITATMNVIYNEDLAAPRYHTVRYGTRECSLPLVDRSIDRLSVFDFPFNCLSGENW